MFIDWLVFYAYLPMNDRNIMYIVNFLELFWIDLCFTIVNFIFISFSIMPLILQCVFGYF